MNKQFKEQITAKAREFATAYTNRHFPNQPSFAFGNEGWAKFVDAMVELASAHPDKGTSALSEVDCVPRAWQITYASADGTSRTVVHGHNAIGDYRQIDPAATSTPLYAAPVAGEKAYRCVGCKHVYFESNVSCDCAVPALHQFTPCHIVDGPLPTGPVVTPTTWLQELERLAEKMMRDSWATGDDAAWKPGMAALLAHAATAPEAENEIPAEDVVKAMLGWQRYEKARKLNPTQWSELHRRNLAGEWFDDMIDALDPVAGAHPDQDTSALATLVVPAPGAIPARIHVTEAMHRAAVNVLHRASGLDGLPQRMMDAMLAATPPQAAPVAQLSEPPEGWKLVPIESTEEMVDAACDIDARGITLAANIKRYAEAGLNGGDYVTTGQIFAEEYKAAIAAAPTTPKDAA